MKKLIVITGLALLTGCASPQWKQTRPVFNCMDYAAAYSRELKSKGYECGTADYNKSSGEAHRIVWLQDKKTKEYIYIEPFYQRKAILTKLEKTTLRNHKRREWIEEGLFDGSKDIPLR